ncbi:hydroxyisourate hydrolase [Actinomadura atramentaria]|uniref:hydroxyisourate hydrolase n=1 Tax=Actinomadura atramentaria TaxID=1990 RepID=UPI001969B63B|nr:hydroxyisourate hydrolase [Actinomadura atramentaria]
MSTHVLDAAAGRPAAGTPVTLERRDAAGEWRRVAAAATDEDGRVRSFGTATPPGAYRLVFDCAGRSPFFPEVSVAFVLAAGGHFHVPLLLSPFAYSTYRGS